jgi:hypothetical protein
MEGTRFDQLARVMATSGSRRRVLGGFLAGALAGLRIRSTAADDSGTAIADASGGNHNHASAADQASSGQDHDHDHDHDHDREHDGGHDHDQGDGARRGAESCPCFEGTCCGRDETCCPQFDEGETQIGLICCDESTSCACGDCVPFCDLNVPFAPCDCNCPPDTQVCTQLDPSTQPFTCCRAGQTCCRVGEGTDAVGTCCDDATQTCTPGVGCSPP